MIAAIDVRGVEKRFGNFVALAGISLTIAEGEFFALLGPNGAGKTTAIKIMVGYLLPSAGTATIAGSARR